MDILAVIPNIELMLKGKKTKETLQFINKNIHILSFFIKDELIYNLEHEYMEKYFVLYKFNLIKKNYRGAVEIVLKYLHSEFKVILDEDSFYSRTLINKALEIFCTGEKIEFLNEFILFLIKNISFIGNVFKIGNSLIDNKKIKNYLIGILINLPDVLLRDIDCIMENKELYYFILIMRGFNREYELEYIDALVYFYAHNIKLNNILSAEEYFEYGKNYYSIVTNSLISDIEVDGSYIISIDQVREKNILFPHINKIITLEIAYRISTLYKKFADELLQYYYTNKIENIYINILETNLNYISSSLLASNNKTNFKLLSYMARSNNLSLNEICASVCISNALMNMGTSNDTFVRSNENSLYKLSARKSKKKGSEIFDDYNTFLSVASVGLIHYGNPNALNIFKNILTNEEFANDGGSAFALGLAHFSSGSFITRLSDSDFILNYYLLVLQSSISDDGISNTDFSRETIVSVIKGCGSFLLGKGNAIRNEQEDEMLKCLMGFAESEYEFYSESAILSIGKIYAGVFSLELFEFLIRIATEDKRNIKAVVSAVSMLFIGYKDKDVLFNDILKNNNNETLFILESSKFKESLIAAILGVLYVNSMDMRVIEYLLNYTYKRDDDVCMIAIRSIGLITIKNRLNERTITILKTYMYSANEHIRATALVTIGLLMASTGDEEVIKLIKDVLKNDSEQVVIQSALLALGMVLNQKGAALFEKGYFEEINSYLHSFYGNYNSGIKMGAAIARGLINMAGTSSTISIFKLNKLCVEGIVGYILVSDVYAENEKYLYYLYLMRDTTLKYLTVDNTELKLINSTYKVNLPYKYGYTELKIKKKCKTEKIVEGEEKDIEQQEFYYKENGDRTTYEELTDMNQYDESPKFIENDKLEQ